ncbi:hypothetical protein BTUL_0210g00070 [Botrytis tulipae]|uniref:2EXR domain-containing protein n=1 Tax=Botrytis tulipae TaxID=87230 RepID=A0A4Z1E8A8_9HELO|nr:hypothetical protein BTUL_0210g00070 [Botrytis tulipae]
MATCVTSSFVPSWPTQTSIHCGYLLPNDDGTRTPYPETPPQFILDIVKTTYGQSSVLKNKKVLKGVEFHCFPNLPIELRKRIWWYSLPGTRVVQLHWAEGKCWSDAEQPVALHVCQESRDTALVHYRLAFKSESSLATTYFDYNIDMLCIAVGTIPHRGVELVRMLRHGISRCDLDLVQHVAVDHYYLNSLLWKPSIGLRDLRDDDACLRSLFPNLRSLTSVVLPCAAEPWHLFEDGPLTFGDYSMDIIIASDEETTKESRPWIVKNKKSVLPWKCSLRPATWEADMSVLWRYIELYGTPSASFRIVALKKLKRDTNWKSRKEYLNGTIYFSDENCLFQATEALSKLVHLRDHEFNTYQKFGCWLAQSFYRSKTLERLRMIDEKASVDPLEVYKWTRCCECQYKHSYPAVSPCQEYEGLDDGFELDEGFNIEDEMRKCLLLTDK